MKITLASMLALAVTTPAFAQQPIADSDAYSEGGDRIVVTASRSGDEVSTGLLGASVTVLDGARLEQRQTRVVSDILRDVPGLAVNRTGGVGGLTQVRIRGSEANHVLMLIDGIEVSDPYQGEYDFATLIADDAARIEVLRGQQSSLYGSDAIGGVIQYITATGSEAPGIRLRAEGGSFGTFNGAARIAGVSGALDYALASSWNHTDGTPTARGGVRDIGSDSVGASAKLVFTASDALRLTAVGRYSLTEADTNNSENDSTSPLFGRIVDSPGTDFRNSAFYGLIRADITAMDGRWTTALSGQFADTTRKGFQSGTLDFGNKGQRYKGSLESTIRFGTDAIAHRLTGAVDVEREQFQTISPSPFAFTGKRRTDNLGLVAQYDVTINDALALGASVRRDENNRFADVTTWRVQGSYALATGTRVHGAYGTGVKNPGYFELYGYSDGRYIGNPDLKPEKSKGWEAGIAQTFGDEKATFGVTYFDNRLEDEIFTTYPAPTFVATPGNRTTQSKQQGVEVSLAARPIPQIQVDAAYTYLKARENGTVEVRRPKHIASLNATLFSTDERFSATFTARYNGRQTDLAFTDPSFIPLTVTLKDYVLVNLSASYAVTPRISVFGRVENALGERYEEIFSAVSAGEAAYAGVKISL